MHTHTHEHARSAHFPAVLFGDDSEAPSPNATWEHHVLVRHTLRQSREGTGVWPL